MGGLPCDRGLTQGAMQDIRQASLAMMTTGRPVYRSDIQVDGAGLSALCVPGRERHPPARAFFCVVAGASACTRPTLAPNFRPRLFQINLFNSKQQKHNNFHPTTAYVNILSYKQLMDFSLNEIILTITTSWLRTSSSKGIRPCF
jgi:hypothetical protein